MNIALHNSATSNGSLQLSPITVNDSYRKKWNINQADFVCLTKNGSLISETLYRVSGFGFNLKDKYHALLKQVEAFYSPDILRMSGSADPKHLESQWCIIDSNGIEKVNFPAYTTPYIVKDSCIYSVDHKYYNIETGEFYCQSYSSIASSEYLFLNNEFDKDRAKRGVMQISKIDGTFKLFN